MEYTSSQCFAVDVTFAFDVPQHVVNFLRNQTAGDWLKAIPKALYNVWSSLFNSQCWSILHLQLCGCSPRNNQNMISSWCFLHFQSFSFQTFCLWVLQMLQDKHQQDDVTGHCGSKSDSNWADLPQTWPHLEVSGPWRYTIHLSILDWDFPWNPGPTTGLGTLKLGISGASRPHNWDQAMGFRWP